MVLRVNSFILKWWANSSADINLPQYTSNNLTFSCKVLTLLCFWGALPASQVALWGPWCYSRFLVLHWTGWKICENREWWLFIATQFTGETAHVEMITSPGILSRYLQHLSSPKLTRGGHKIITLVQYVLQLILSNYDLIMNLYVCISVNGTRVVGYEFVCVKSW